MANLVKNWKVGILIWNSKYNLDMLAEVEANLLEIGEGIGANLQVGRLKAAGREKKGELETLLVPFLCCSRTLATNVKASKFKLLAGTSEVQEVIGLLEQIFAEDAEVPEFCTPSTIAFGVPDSDGKDPGVGPESTMSYSQLCSNLGLNDRGNLAIFNEYQHSSKESPWTPDGQKIFAAFEKLGDAYDDGDEFSPSRSHFHQVAGMHSALRQMFGAQKTTQSAMGLLIADAPGLGKTRMSASIAAWLVENGLKQDLKKPLPPLLSK